MDGYRITSDAYLMTLLVVGGINTAISLFYYLRVAKVMTIDPPPEGTDRPDVPLSSPLGAFVVCMTVPLALLIVNWDMLNRWALAAVAKLIS